MKPEFDQYHFPRNDWAEKPTIIRDYFEVEKMKRDLPKKEWAELTKSQFEMLEIIMQNKILRPLFFQALDEHLEEAKRRTE